MARRVLSVSIGTVRLTGASGLLGTWLRRTAPVGFEVVGLTHRTRLGASGQIVADLRDPIAVIAAVHEVRPSLVLHAAYARDEASIVGATQNVVDAAQGTGAGVLYVSTDAVFSGSGPPLPEDATPDPVRDYGRWKPQAERAEGSTMKVRAIKAERTPPLANRPRHINLEDGRASECINWSPSRVLCGGSTT